MVSEQAGLAQRANVIVEFFISETTKQKIQKRVKRRDQSTYSLHDHIFQVGIWHDQYGIQFQRNFTETFHEIVESLQNKTLVVTTIRVKQVPRWTYA